MAAHHLAFSSSKSPISTEIEFIDSPSFQFALLSVYRTVDPGISWAHRAETIYAHASISTERWLTSLLNQVRYLRYDLSRDAASAVLGWISRLGCQSVARTQIFCRTHARFQYPRSKLRWREGNRSSASDPNYAETGAAVGMPFRIGSRAEANQVPV